MLLNFAFKSIRTFLLSVFSCLALMGSAFAAVDANSADQAALESVRGLGPSKAQAILAERKKNGPFKDAQDLHTRVKGIGEKTVERLMKNGLTVNGKSAGVGKKESTKSEAKTKDKVDSADKSTRSPRKSKQD